MRRFTISLNPLKSIRNEAFVPTITGIIEIHPESDPRKRAMVFQRTPSVFTLTPLVPGEVLPPLTEAEHNQIAAMVKTYHDGLNKATSTFFWM